MFSALSFPDFSPRMWGALVLVFNSNFINSRDTYSVPTDLKPCLVTREGPETDKLVVSAFRELTIYFKEL